MKRSLYSALLLALFVGHLSQASSLKFGAGVGLNIANTKATLGTLSGTGNSTGRLALGVDLEILLTDWFSIDPGFMFIGKGAENAVNANYFEFPVLAALKLGPSIAKFVLQAGPALGIKISGTGYTGTDFSLQLGGGGEVSLGVFDLFLYIRYLLGVSNVIDNPVPTQTQKNRGILFFAGLKFPLGD